MSLLKARVMYSNLPISDTSVIRNEFLDLVDNILSTDTKIASTEQIVNIVQLYIEASINYLIDAACLNDNADLHSTMKFMNSYLAEFMHGSGLHYFHQEGMTIVDLAMQEALDNGGILSSDVAQDIIARIEGSYAEEVEEEH